jgi:hypothetical protein
MLAPSKKAHDNKHFGASPETERLFNANCAKVPGSETKPSPGNSPQYQLAAGSAKK